jgi:cysteine desulfurase
MKIDLASVTAHKIYGPKGIGALLRPPEATGSHRPDHRRLGARARHALRGPSTWPASSGFGKAAEIARTEMAAESARILALRERLGRKLTSELDMVHPSTARSSTRLPGNLNISFAYVEGEALMMAIKDVAVSSGLGLHLRLARAVVRARGPGSRGGHGALLHPLRARPLQHGVPG